MTSAQARALFLDHCQPGDRGTMERYGEKAAVAAIMAATADIRQHVTHLIYAIDRGYFGDDSTLRTSAFIEPLRARADPDFKPIKRVTA